MAELVMEITASGAIRNVVHRNLFLISACNADEAYQKAQQLGSRGEQSYQNPDGQRVEHRFRGVAKLDGVVDGTLEDGSELGFTEHIGILEEQIGQWICSKEKLGAFLHLMPLGSSTPTIALEKL